VWGAINSFAAWTGRRLDWPLSEEDILKFASWCDVERKLQASTIKTYLQSLSKIQQLRGGPRICLSKIPVLQDFLAGVRNVPRIPRKSVKKTVSFPLLQILGQVVGKDESKTTFDKLRFWTVCLWSFFGSFRIGELLSEQKKNYDPHRTLLWKDVGLTNKDELTIPIKSPKIPRPGGEIVLLFPCKDRTVCPVRLFQEYQEVARETGLVEDDLPVFRNEDGTSWSKSEFRNELDYFMAQTGVVRTGEKIVCHSFRGGIPSMLESLGTPEAEGASQEWGRWRSSAYKCYTHYHLTKKRKIFETVCSLLLN
jgi:integrase